jgi:hypothetical protein
MVDFVKSKPVIVNAFIADPTEWLMFSDSDDPNEVIEDALSNAVELSDKKREKLRNNLMTIWQDMNRNSCFYCFSWFMDSDWTHLLPTGVIFITGVDKCIKVDEARDYIQKAHIEGRKWRKDARFSKIEEIQLEKCNPSFSLFSQNAFESGVFGSDIFYFPQDMDCHFYINGGTPNQDYINEFVAAQIKLLNTLEIFYEKEGVDDIS